MLLHSRVAEKRFSYSVSAPQFLKGKNASDGLSLNIQLTPSCDLTEMKFKSVLSETMEVVNERAIHSFSREENSALSFNVYPAYLPFEVKVFVSGKLENGIAFEDSFAFFIGHLKNGDVGVVEIESQAKCLAGNIASAKSNKEGDHVIINLDKAGDAKGDKSFNIVFDAGFHNPWNGVLQKLHSFKIVVFNKGSVVQEQVLEMEDWQRIYLNSTSYDLKDIIVQFKTENNTTWIDPMKIVQINMANFYTPGQTDYGTFFPTGGDEWDRAYFTLDQLFLFRKTIGNLTSVWMPKFKTKFPSTDVKPDMAQWNGFWNEMVLGKVFHSYWVVAHEFGHGVMDHALGALPLYDVIAIHDVDTIDNKGGGHAWVEGFAEFMQVFLTGGNTGDCRPALFGSWYKDSSGKPFPTDIETPEAPSRKWLSGFSDTGVAGSNDKGWMIEGVIAAFLWDLQDSNPDADDTESALFTNIIAVINDKKPKNMMEFIYGWGDKFGFSAGFGNLYWHHQIGGPSVKLEEIGKEFLTKDLA